MCIYTRITCVLEKTFAMLQVYKHAAILFNSELSLIFVIKA